MRNFILPGSTLPALLSSPQTDGDGWLSPTVENLNQTLLFILGTLELQRVHREILLLKVSRITVAHSFSSLNRPESYKPETTPREQQSSQYRWHFPRDRSLHEAACPGLYPETPGVSGRILRLRQPRLPRGCRCWSLHHSPGSQGDCCCRLLGLRQLRSLQPERIQ